MLKEELKIVLERIDKLNELYKETYRDYKVARSFYSNSSFLSEDTNKTAFIDYSKHLESVCVLGEAMSILGLPTEEIEKEVDYEVDYEQN